MCPTHSATICPSSCTPRTPNLMSATSRMRSASRTDEPPNLYTTLDCVCVGLGGVSVEYGEGEGHGVPGHGRVGEGRGRVESLMGVVTVNGASAETRAQPVNHHCCCIPGCTFFTSKCHCHQATQSHHPLPRYSIDARAQENAKRSTAVQSCSGASCNHHNTCMYAASHQVSHAGQC